MDLKTIYVHQNAWSELSQICVTHPIELCELLFCANSLLVRVKFAREPLPKLMRVLERGVLCLEVFNNENEVFIISAKLEESINDAKTSFWRYPAQGGNFKQSNLVDILSHLKVQPRLVDIAIENFQRSFELLLLVENNKKENSDRRYWRHGLESGDSRIVFAMPSDVKYCCRDLMLKNFKRAPFYFVFWWCCQYLNRLKSLRLRVLF